MSGSTSFDGLTSLADHHLVRLVDDLQSEPRFTMLETVREFALEQLALAASGEADVIRGRHAAWCLELAEESEMATRGGPEQARWLARLETELPNLRQALGWLEETGDTEAMMRLAGALGGFWFWRSRRVEGSAWLERALAAADTTPTAGRGEGAAGPGRSKAWSRGAAHAAAYAAESVAVWTALGDAWRAADARLALGQILEYQTDYEQAIPLLEESAREWDALGDPVRAAMALSSWGRPRWITKMHRGQTPSTRRRWAGSARAAYTWGVSGRAAPTRRGGRHAGRRDRPPPPTTPKAWTEPARRENLVGKLVAAGRLAAVGGHAETAARVLGAAEALADTIGYVRRRPEQERLERDAAVARAALGDAGFEAAWAAGQALPIEQAVAEAQAVLAVLGAPAAPSPHDPRNADRTPSVRVSRMSSPCCVRA